MKLHRNAHQAILRSLTIAVFALPVVAACGDSESTATTAPTTTVATTSTEAPADPASNIESLSYLMQGLLTTPEIGGGWIDMGRVIVPPRTETYTGPLCPDGQALAAPIGTTLNPQVHTTYRHYSETQATIPADTGAATAPNPALVGGMVMETLLWNERQMVDDAFAAAAAATAACVGQTWVDPDMGNTVMTTFEAPRIGTDSFTFGFAPVEPGSDPWAETQAIMILMSDPSSPAAIVMTVSMTVVHDQPDQQTPGPDTDELIRIAQAAVTRIQAGI